MQLFVNRALQILPRPGVVAGRSYAGRYRRGKNGADDGRNVENDLLFRRKRASF